MKKVNFILFFCGRIFWSERGLVSERPRLDPSLRRGKNERNRSLQFFQHNFSAQIHHKITSCAEWKSVILSFPDGSWSWCFRSLSKFQSEVSSLKYLQRKKVSENMRVISDQFHAFLISASKVDRKSLIGIDEMGFDYPWTRKLDNAEQTVWYSRSTV